MFKLEQFDEIASRHSGIVAEYPEETETEMVYFKLRYELSREDKLENSDVYHQFINPHLHEESPVIEGVEFEYDEHFSPNPNRPNKGMAEFRGDNVEDLVETAHRYLEQMGVTEIENYWIQTEVSHQTLAPEDLEAK